MTEDNPVVGYTTFQNPDGTLRHEPLRKDEAELIWKACEDARKKRADLMPTEQAALDAMFQAWYRLKELGWKEAIYCPKDGTLFFAIEAGSTGIHDCHYEGDWPDGSWWTHAAGDLWPSRPILFKQKEAQP